MPDQAVILLVEDSDDDAMLINRAFSKARVINPVQVVTGGEQAIAYIKGEGLFRNREEFPLPELVLLDLAMPGVDGFEVLKWIRRQPHLNAMRVVVLTASSDLQSVTRAYELGANSFLVKPLDFSDFVALANALQGYWLWMSRMPGLSRAPNLGKQTKSTPKTAKSKGRGRPARKLKTLTGPPPLEIIREVPPEIQPPSG